jgi:Co/Zn/Cd efflux system component
MIDWKITNQGVLQINFVLFAVFVVAEVFGALTSNSLSLLGDACAMSVDVFTYLGNMLAECAKSQPQFVSTKRSKMFLEVVIPTVSVLCLVAVTFYITYDALVLLRNPPIRNDVEVIFLYRYILQSPTPPIPLTLTLSFL